MSADHALSVVAEFLGAAPAFEPGHVWLVGAGPGDPRLLTLEAVHALASADVVVHDALVDPRVLRLARPGAALAFAGKRGGKPSADQADITARLVALAREGRRVLRLKGGDPFVFGRGGEEMLALAAAGVPFRVVPGLTAGLAGLAAVGIPATMRSINQAVILATGHAGTGPEGLDWAALARTGQPIVLYMATASLAPITAALVAGGLAADTPAALVAAATTASERIVVSTLDRLARDVRRAGLAPPAVVAVGGIVAVRERLLALSRVLEAAR
jgi:uroporphyrin-III C-methyltransferase